MSNQVKADARLAATLAKALNFATSELQRSRDQVKTLLGVCRGYEAALVAVLESQPPATEMSLALAMTVVSAREKGNAAIASVEAQQHAPEVSHTPRGYDPRWIEAINQVLEDRGSYIRIDDISENLWDEFIGPMIDAIEDRRVAGDE